MRYGRYLQLRVICETDSDGTVYRHRRDGAYNTNCKYRKYNL